jgi:hypothetical protein
MRAFRSYIIIFAFIAVIAFPLLNKCIGIVNDIGSSENRQLSAAPTFEFNKLDPFPSLYDKYYSDHFTLRSRIIKAFNVLNIKLFEKSPIPDQVVIGKDGWLFMSGNEIDAYTGKLRFSNQELDLLRQELEYRKTYLDSLHCQFYFSVAPTKACVYEDKLPNTIYKFAKESLGEQLMNYLDSATKLNVINLHETFRKNKTEDLYYKLDNHWSELGAFYAAQDILTKMKIEFTDLETRLLTDYTIERSNRNQGNIVNMLSDTTLYKDFSLKMFPKNGFRAEDTAKMGYPSPEGFAYPWGYEVNKHIKGSKAPKILIISDSFGESLFPFLSEEFRRSVKIFDAWQYKLNPEIVIKEKPDIVLIIALEDNLKNMFDHFAFKKAK